MSENGEDKGEDEVTAKKKVSIKEASKKKKTPKETKKKVTKKITKKKAPKKKKGPVVKGNIKNLKKAGKNVKVKTYETRGVARGNLSFLKTQVNPNQTGGGRLCPCTTASPPNVTYQTFNKNYHGSIQINCRYTKVFSNQL